jgi:hypothetical protein
MVDLEGDIALLDHALGGADDRAVAGDLDEDLLTDVVLIALDRDEITIGEHHDIVRERRRGRRRTNSTDHRYRGERHAQQGDNEPPPTRQP